jgi:nucleoid-associated protein YgaU
MASADPSNPDALTDLVRHGASGLAVLASVLLVLAVVGEVLRRRHRARRVLAVIDAVVPGAARTVAVSLVAAASAVGVSRPAGADDSLRGWLGRPTTTTTIAGPVVTPDALDALTDTSTTTGTVPPGPPVLVPATTPASTPMPTPPPSTLAPPAPTPAPAPVAVSSPAPEVPVHVVQRGDCLWSIAASRLGPGADARAIDAGWRRIYAENRAAVGDDPNLIHPGLVLRLPPLDVQP